MRYPDEHKAQTRQRIIDEASRRFRRDGVAVTGLQPLMKALGLTHGGFYAHFASKDELVELALESAKQQLDASAEPLFMAENPLQRFIETYLSAQHRDHPDAGCPLPTLCAELGQRGTPSSYTDQVIEQRSRQIAGALQDADQARARLILAALVGGLSLARSTKDRQLADELLWDVASQLLELVGQPNEK